jgi:site-specific DNA-adenine methylase
MGSINNRLYCSRAILPTKEGSKMNLITPFPYFGGKKTIASEVWGALGQPKHYIEPFFGSGAVLLLRPRYDPLSHIETVNDLDGNLANVWRSLQAAPDEVAKYCDWPVNHVDLAARRKVLNQEYACLASKMVEDEAFFDAKLAGYWIWASCCWIGSGLVDSKRPHLSDGGRGVHSKIPHLGDAGMGVHSQIPHLSNAGGVQEPYTFGLYEWFRVLSERLRKVRVVCGDWSRVCGGNWQDKLGEVGIFMDPPYSKEADRKSELYTEDCLEIAHKVRGWCIIRGKQKSYRIALAGYFEEHKELLEQGWFCKKWSANGGYSHTSGNDDNKNRHKETIFYSPNCFRNVINAYQNIEKEAV